MYVHMNLLYGDEVKPKKCVTCAVCTYLCRSMYLREVDRTDKKKLSATLDAGHVIATAKRAGLKRIFSKRGMVELTKSLVKIVVVAAAVHRASPSRFSARQRLPRARSSRPPRPIPRSRNWKSQPARSAKLSSSSLKSPSRPTCWP